MIVKPRIKGFICTTAHPAGCRRDVENQFAYARSRPLINRGPKKVLVIGASRGYGLATRITAAINCAADTLGVFLEMPAVKNRTS